MKTERMTLQIDLLDQDQEIFCINKTKIFISQVADELLQLMVHHL